jgi:hypothetical protein
MEFKITKEEAEIILNTLLQFPAKDSLRAIDVLRGLKPIQDAPKDETPT